ncbi:MULTISPECIES: winged helix-turn-helix transcriptional regulator [Pseudomonas syringae group]|uniref:winged helix-turn-helix transcriptional regulator n=1 Tax=Pseudomonas syringae group TaxID=136849 RepID=UPI000EFE6D14|nr:helix-turn-helix domain-containing protein [Pseudomonas syringae group genomosp. 3]
MLASSNDSAISCNLFAKELLNRVGDKWSILIVGYLAGGPMRFNELRRAIGLVSQRMLTLTLKNLEKDGLVKRTAFPTVPPRVDYELTPLGKTFREPIKALVDWAIEHQPDVNQARIAYGLNNS